MSPRASLSSESAQNAIDSIATGAQNAKNAVVDTTKTAYNAAANAPLTQNIKNTVVNGPIAETVKTQASKTSSEFTNLSVSRQRPAAKATTGQALTHYHNFFSSLFSWENPRASAIAYASVVGFIFAARYLDLLRYALKVTWWTLGVTVVAEVAGRTLFNTGFVSQIRPRKYYVLPKETLDSMTEDLDELVNFFVIETQRLLFAENVFASSVAFLSAFTSYYLVKVVPFWGLSLIATSALFLTPLIYKQNKEVIDAQIAHASRVVNQQTTQVRAIAKQQASAAAATTKQYVDDYSAKAQEIIAQRGRSVSPMLRKAGVKGEKKEEKKEEKKVVEEKKEKKAVVLKEEDFPAAPKEEVAAAAAVSSEAEEAPTVRSSVNNLREEGPLLG